MAEPLKNLVDRSVVEDLGERFSACVPGFDTSRFVADVMAELPELELKARFDAIARRLRASLDPDYSTALEAILEVATAEPPIEGFAAWPLCTFVERYGVDHPDASLAAMEHLTKRASCEFAIRPFLRDHFDAAYATLQRFAAHEDDAVRRLASEGTRPLLPWATRVPALLDDPAPGLALLEMLRHDRSDVVRRSVANHLNDVAKNDPELVVSTTRRWRDETPPVYGTLIRHALRTLVKRGDPAALDVLGFTTDPSVDVVSFTVAPESIGLGQRIELAAELRSTSSMSQRLVVDFVIHHVTASGGASPKVFKWTTVELAPGGSTTLTKHRSIQPASTRTYHGGTHRIDLQVAGKVIATAGFDLEV